MARPPQIAAVPLDGGEESLKRAELRKKRLRLPETAHRVLAVGAVAAEPAVAEGGQLFPADDFADKDAGQDQIKHGDLMEHTAGGNAENWHIANTADQEHGPRQYRGAINR